MNKFLKYWDAINFASRKHGITLRKDGKTPYIAHPLRVAAILRSVGLSEFKNEDLMIAALCHDVLEDTDTSLQEIKNEFGNRVASIVSEVSKPEKVNKEEWLRNFDSASREAKIIKMADRIDNLMDMDIVDWSNEKKKSYARQGEIILEKCGNVNRKLANILKEVIEKILDD